jgi:transglutaminase-like putative cysteine protease
MNYKIFVLLAVLVLGCSRENGLISNKAAKVDVKTKFQSQKHLAERRANVLFNVFDSIHSIQEKEALEFLYAYMPLSDLADYTGEYFLQQVRYALLARKTFTWGKKIPNEIFLHFVLPYRVNNENPDAARSVFYHELKNRIIGLSMKEAALEVNHWCHEKVSYHPSDIRTSSPLTTVKNALGRCGEESTLTVTAMRSVGIPARQIYTPRWAHSDDNHAWVEVWIDGDWKFLGACEPEPDLNMGWFAEPATRAMLLHTKVFGKYITSEDIVNQDDRFTEINVLPSYASAKRVYVQVSDSSGSPLNNAKVQFKLYNYAEFYPIAKTFTNGQGMCSLLTGKGDLIVWASKGNMFNYKKLRVAETDTIRIVLNKTIVEGEEENFILVPPGVGEIVMVSDSLSELNNQRLKYEDSLRHTYESTFIDSISAVNFAGGLNLKPKRVWEVLKRSRGNWKEISSFLIQTPENLKDVALHLLQAISEKDLHDTHIPVLNDHLFNSVQLEGVKDYLYYHYVLNSHISNELQSPYKQLLQDFYGEDFIKMAQQDINVLVKWINDSISINDKANTWRTPIRPKGVLELRHADKHSRNIFFVAACRSFGIPAQLEPSRSIPQIFKDNQWIDVSFEEIKAENLAKSELTVLYNGGLDGLSPGYYTHFTIGRFDGSSYKTLDFEYSDAFDSFPVTISVDTGRYTVITGKRLASGTVLTKVKYFNLSKDQNSSVLLEFNQQETENEILGYIDLNRSFEPISGNSDKKISFESLSNNTGLVIIWIDPDKEPTKHLLNDLKKLKSHFDTWSGSFVFMIPGDKYNKNFETIKLDRLPKKSHFTIDTESFFSELQLKEFSNQQNYPFVIVANPKGEISYTSQGYRIGSGEQILNIISNRCSIN